MDHQELFLDLYDDVSPSAEYFQADSAVRNFMFEAAIIAGLGFAIGAFASNFFGTLGKAAGDSVIQRTKAAFKKTEEKGDRDAMLEGLALMAPFLKALPGATDAQRTIYRKAISAALVAKGFTEDVAESTSTDMMTTLMDAAGKA